MLALWVLLVTVLFTGVVNISGISPALLWFGLLKWLARRRYLALWGVPLTRAGINFAASSLYRSFVEQGDSDPIALDRLLERNEKVVNRSSMLINFCTILISIYIFVAQKTDILVFVWQDFVYYGVIGLWTFFLLRLLYSMRFRIPPATEFGTFKDFLSAADMYYTRMGRFNQALIVSIFSFLIMSMLIAPFSRLQSDAKAIYIPHDVSSTVR